MNDTAIATARKLTMSMTTTGARPADGDDDPAERRPDEAGETAAGRQRGVGGGQLFRPNEPWEQRHVGRVVQLRQRCLTGDDDVRGPHPRRGDRQQRAATSRPGRRWWRRGSGADRTGRRDCRRTARASPPRSAGTTNSTAVDGARPGLGEHVDRESDHQHPVAGVVDQPAGPRQPEVACTPHRRGRRARRRSRVVGAGKGLRTRCAPARHPLGVVDRAPTRYGRSRSSTAALRSRSSAAETDELVAGELGGVLPLGGQLVDPLDERAAKPIVLDLVGAAQGGERGPTCRVVIAQRSTEREPDRRRPPPTGTPVGRREPAGSRSTKPNRSSSRRW